MALTNVHDIRYLTNTKSHDINFDDGHTAGLAYCTIEEWNENYIECEDIYHSNYLSPKIDLMDLDINKSYVWEYNTSSWVEDDASQWSVNYFNNYNIIYGLYHYASGWSVFTDASYTSDRRVNIYQNDFYTLPYNWENIPVTSTQKLYAPGSAGTNPQLLGWDYILNTLSLPGLLKKYTIGATNDIGALALKKNYSTTSTNYPDMTLATRVGSGVWSSQVRTNKGRDLTYYSDVSISAPVLTYKSWDWTAYPSSHKYKINVGVKNTSGFPIVYTTRDDMWDIYLGGKTLATSILFFTQTWSVTNTGTTKKYNTIPDSARINFSYRPLHTNSVTTQSISQTFTGSIFPRITNIGMGHNDMWVYYRNGSDNTSPIHQILESASDVSEYRHGYREYNVDGGTDELSKTANLLVNLGSSAISPESNSVAASDHALYQYIIPTDQATSTTAAQNVSVNWTDATTEGSFYEIGMRGPQITQIDTRIHKYNSTSSLKNWILAEAYGSDISTASNPRHRTYSIANSNNIITYSRKFNNVFLELTNVSNFTSQTVNNFRYDKLNFTFNIHCLDTTDSDAQIPNAYMICGICRSLKNWTRADGPTWATQTIAGFAMVDSDTQWNKPLFKDYSGTDTPPCFTTISSVTAPTYISISNITDTGTTITANCYCGLKSPEGGLNYYYSPFIPITLFWKETGNNLPEDRYYVKYYGLFYKDLTYTNSTSWATRDNWYLVPLDVNYRTGAITWKCWHQQKYISSLPFSTSSRTESLNPFYFFKDLYSSSSWTWIGALAPHFYRGWTTAGANVDITKVILTSPSSYTSTNISASITYTCSGNISGNVYIDLYTLALLSNDSADTMSSIFTHSYVVAQ